MTQCPRRDHITPYLQSLHWLPVECRIIFKILLLAYKCMNNLAPNYLSELITPYNQNRYPTKGKFEHRYNNPPIFKKKSYGERSFTFAAPTEWNKLPLEVKQASCFDSFKKTWKHTSSRNSLVNQLLYLITVILCMFMCYLTDFILFTVFINCDIFMIFFYGDVSYICAYIVF